MPSPKIIQFPLSELLVNEVTEEFNLQYGNKPEIVTLAPGRINIIGEHTDYNEGLAMPVAIDLWICTAISKYSKDYFSVFSINYRQSVKLLPNATNVFSEPWIKLVSSVINILKSEYGILGGGKIVIGGNIPIGCGLSSSTAFVISVTIAFCNLFKIRLRKRELAIICKKIENLALGLAHGLLDQYAIILSKKDQFMIIDFQDDSIKYLPLSLNGCLWIVINSRINRELSKSAYINRVKECRKGLEILNSWFNINSFRDIDNNMLLELEKGYNIPYKRLLHLLGENIRVKKMKVQLEKGNKKQIGKILQESHESLKTLYEVSCMEIDYIVKISESFDGWYGGRIIGGGFGGCSLHLIAENVIEKYGEYISKNLGKKYGVEPDLIQVLFPGGVS